jgi:hypothetical protein
MGNSEHQEKKVLFFKIVQSGDSIKIPLTEKNLASAFKEIYFTLLKDLKLKKKDIYISNEDGKMIGALELDLSLEAIINKFGTKLKIYYEKVI